MVRLLMGNAITMFSSCTSSIQAEASTTTVPAAEVRVVDSVSCAMGNISKALQQRTEKMRRDLNNMHQQHFTSTSYFPISSLHAPFMLDRSNKELKKTHSLHNSLPPNDETSRCAAVL